MTFRMGLPDRPENLPGASWMGHAAKPYGRSPKDGAKNFFCLHYGRGHRPVAPLLAVATRVQYNKPFLLLVSSTTHI
jgi:hypothetical protein